MQTFTSPKNFMAQMHQSSNVAWAVFMKSGRADLPKVNGVDWVERQPAGRSGVVAVMVTPKDDPHSHDGCSGRHA